MPRSRTGILTVVTLFFGFGLVINAVPVARADFSLSATLRDPNPTAGENLGSAVAISLDGDSVLIGAPGATASGLSNAGKAFLFDSSGNLLQTFEPGNRAGPIDFGRSVSLSAYTSNVLVGAPSDFGPSGTMIGSVFLFDSGGNMLQNLHDPTPQEGEQFGSSVFISAESRTISVGAPLATSGSTGDAGKAFLFDSDGDLLQTFRGGIEGGRLGTSVSLSGDGSAVLIGETGRHDFGHAYLFDSFGNLLQTVSGRNFPDSFGFSVAISGHHTPTQMDAYQHNHAQNSFVVGAPYANVPDSSGVIGEGLAFFYAGP